MNAPVIQMRDYLSGFDPDKVMPRAGNEPWLQAVRKSSRSRLEEGGFPHRGLEAWKYTDVTPILRAGFTLAAPGTARPGLDALMAICPDIEPDAHRLVFVDGYFDAGLSAVDRLPAGSLAAGLDGAAHDHAELLNVNLGRALHGNGGFTALNGAYAPDGAVVHIPEGVQIDEAIHLIFLATANAETHAVQPRNLIIAGRGSRAAIVERYVAGGGASYFTNAITEVVLEAEADIDHYRVQEEAERAYHINGLHVLIDRGGRFRSHGIDVGGRLVRNEVYCRLVAEHGRCELNGLYLTRGRQHVDNHTRIDHVKGETTSREFYKGVLQGRSRAVFHGHIKVHPDAQRIDARQTNKNLLLSPDAEADSQPRLEIYADDVQCSHGATVGQLDEQALFYLRSRGIDLDEARYLLTQAFARDVLEGIRPITLRERLEKRLFKLLARELPAAGAAR